MPRWSLLITAAVFGLVLAPAAHAGTTLAVTTNAPSSKPIGLKFTIVA